jgi:asparagine synthetase B (glutamine-hydrolysing)
MCGILAALGLAGDSETIRRKVLQQSRRLRHRGPDASAIWQSANGKNCIAFERLQIIDVSDAGKCDFPHVLLTMCIYTVTCDKVLSATCIFGRFTVLGYKAQCC